MRSHAQKMEDRCAYASILFYSVAVAFGIAGFVLAAYSRTMPGIVLGTIAVVSAVLSILTARASIRWRKAK